MVGGEITGNQHHQASGSILSRVVSWWCSVVSNSLGPYGLYLTRFLCPWSFPGENTGVCCHFLLQVIFSTHTGIERECLVSPALAGRFFYHWAIWEACAYGNIQFSPFWREFQHLHNNSKDMTQKAVYNSRGRTKYPWLHWMAKLLFLSCLTDFLFAFSHFSD